MMYFPSQGYAAVPSTSYTPGNSLEQMAYAAVNYKTLREDSAGRYTFFPMPAVPYSMLTLSMPPQRALGSALYAMPGCPYQTERNAEMQCFASTPHAEYHFTPAEFLKPGKEGKFVAAAGEIREFVEEAFEKLVHLPFPHDIKVSVLPAERFRKLAPHPGVAGLSFNRRTQGLLSEVFVLQDALARVLLTIGHELGHVLTSTLEDAHDEEAKAYAFSLAWISTIKKHNIANLAGAVVTERPAENGLHNVAFFWVEKLRKAGKSAGEIYTELTRGVLSVTSETAEGFV